MQRSSKSIVVKQRGAAGAGSLPTGDVNSAGTALGAARGKRGCHPAGLARAGPSCVPFLPSR